MRHVSIADLPPSESVRMDVDMHISLLRRASIRDFAGRAVGKTRRLAIVPVIARDMAERISRYHDVSLGDDQVTDARIANVIADVMMVFPAEDAFKLAAIDREEKCEARDHLTSVIASALCTTFRFARKKDAGVATRVEESNGWMLHEVIPSDMTPIYKWHPSWIDNRRDDLVGYNGNNIIGRVFRVPLETMQDKWFWLLYPLYTARDQSSPPFAGWERSDRMACCRVELCYERFLQKMIEEDDQNVQSL